MLLLSPNSTVCFAKLSVFQAMSPIGTTTRALLASLLCDKLTRKSRVELFPKIVTHELIQLVVEKVHIRAIHIGLTPNLGSLCCDRLEFNPWPDYRTTNSAAISAARPTDNARNRFRS